MKKLDGKVALITGGGRGIGRGIVECFIEEGAHVVIAQRSEVPDDLLEFGGENISHHKIDLSDSVAIKTLIHNFSAKYGQLDILVNNAGLMFEMPVEEMEESDWDAMMAINLKAPFLLCKYSVPIMRKLRAGSIINIGSIEGIASNPNHSAYCTSKAGIHGLTRALAIDLGLDGIRCNAIAPGWIESDLSQIYLESLGPKEKVEAELKRLHPVGRLGMARDIGATAVFLASDSTDFLTGQVITVDGGRTAKLSLPSV
ncbi:SDR family NAD(P)-dependent oxidoreductase [Kiloniella sp.]|uniref:SDR family NAD(P)-dependent oxidoreductase n=1 Tax=Kiloniella sp. TaxID=1938587 RepID=UPI003B02186B